MAEAFGIAGSAVGIVSLGLQLYGGITTYFDALEGRDDDLASARAQLDSLRGSLVTIQSALPPLPSASATAGTGSGTVPPIVRECEKELSQLDTLLRELAGSSTSSKKLKDRVKTLRFPFRRDNLMKLEDRLHMTNSVFQTALSVFHLNKSLGNEQKLADVEAATTQIPAINANVAQVSTELQGLRTDVAQISADTNNTVTMLHSNNTTVISLADNFGSFAPEAISRLGEVKQSLDTVARQDDIRELSRTSENNTDVIRRVDVSVALMAATTESKLALIENSAQNSASADQEILQKLSNLENLLGLQGGERPANSQVVLRRVLAKPSQTREIFDSVAPLRSTTRHNGSSFQEANELSLSSKFQGPSCTCLLRKSRQGTSRNFGPFWLRTETSYHGHSQTCQLSKWHMGRNSRWFELTTVRRLSFWSWAVGVSFAISTGAGGLSISPKISYRPVVDEETSPVFRIVDILGDFLSYSSAKRLNQSEVSRCLSAAASAILTLYQEKKAFPYEVNTRGESAVYKMVVMLGYQISWREPFCDFVIWAVEEVGLPANICDFSGRTPVMEIASRHDLDNDDGVQPLLSILYEKAPESVIHYDMLKDWFYYGDGFWMVRHVPSGSAFGRIQSEIFGYGPLSAAIVVQHGAEQINDLINATNICEVNLFGQTPLHVAVVAGNLDVLATLLRSPHILDILHLQDFQGNHAIDYAVAYDGWHCSEPRSHVPCSECCCTDRLGMLLCVEGCFDGYLESISDAPTFVRNLCYGSLRSNFLLLSKLKVKRDRIKHMALKHLGNEDIQRYKLDRDNVLDYHGIDVVERLNDIGIKVPATLQNSFLKSDRRRSIYHNLPHNWYGRPPEQVAQLIFDLGFHDADEPDEMGRTPLMLFPKDYGRLAVIHWFMEHGADCTLRDPCTASITYYRAHVNPTIAQQVVTTLLSNAPINRYLDSRITTPIARVVPVDTIDDCNCSCMEDGCSSASILFWELWSKGYNGGDEYATRRRKALPRTGSDIAMSLEKYSLDFTSHRHVCLAALRMLTFAALGIRHTCGCKHGFIEPRLSSDEIEGIWEEDAHLIELLEELHTEFATKFDASDINFSAFLATEWGPRMENVLGGLDGYKLSKAERAGAEALGVQWQTQEEEAEEVEEEFPYVTSVGMSVEDFFRELRRIENE